MEDVERERAIARIISAQIRFRHEDSSLLIQPASRAERSEAQDVYEETFREASLAGCYTDDELLVDFMLAEGHWDAERENMMSSLPKDIEELKVALFKAEFKSEQRKVVRKALNTAKDKLSELSNQRAAYRHLTCSGVAAMAKTRFLVACGLRNSRGSRIKRAELLDAAMAAYAASRLDESAFRELARTDPWRLLWSCRKSGDSLFGVAVADWTDDQLRLVNYSMLYENISEHPECPSDDVIEDDDRLDGWMILKRRERDVSRNQKTVDGMITNEKIRNSQEIFVPVQSPEDAKRVESMNTGAAGAIKRQRLGIIEKKGEVNELDFPDTRARIITELNSRSLKS